MSLQRGDNPLQTPEEEDPVDLEWLVEAHEATADDPAISAATSSPPLLSSRQAMPRMPSLPDMHPYQQHSLPRPVSAESNFSAAASSPSTHMTQAGRSDRQGDFRPGSMRLITTGLRTSAALADPSLAGQEGSQDVQRSLRSRAGGESTTGTAQGTAPDTSSPRGRGRMLRSRSGTASVKDEEMQEAGASPVGPDSPGVFRSLRKRPQPNYAQAAVGESDSDASSAPKSEEEDKLKAAEPKKSQRGRKRRTEPIVVEKEDGTKEEVSPQVYRRLRRRVTNRLSARRMRQKRAEEREQIAAETSKLHQETAMLRARMAELEGANRSLAREAYSWQQRYEQLVGPSLGAPQQQPPSGGPRLDSPFPSIPTPGAEKRTQSLPVPQQQQQQQQQQGALEAQQARSMSPGGFDSFTLAAEYPSLHMLSPQSQQTPLYGRPQQTQGGSGAQQQLQLQQHTPLSQQSFQGSVLGPSHRGGLGGHLGRQGSPVGMAYYAGLAGLQTSASPGDLPSTPEHEQLRSSQAGSQYGPRLHLRSSPYSISPDLQQRLPQHPSAQDPGRSLMSPRHFSAPNLSQGAMDLYQHRGHLSGDASATLASAFGQQGGGLESRGSFGHPGLEARGSFGQQPGLHSRAGYAQGPVPGSLQFARRSSGGLAAEEELKRSSAPAELQQEAFGGQMAFRDGVPSSPPRQPPPHWGDPPGRTGN